MALRPSDLDRRKAPFVDDKEPFPTDDEVANHLGINPDVFKITPAEGNKPPAPPAQPEAPSGEGKG